MPTQRPIRAILPRLLPVLVLTVVGALLAACTTAPEPSETVRPSQEGVAWPLRTANDRVLVDADDEAFLMVADTAWSLLGNLTAEQAKQYIDLRKQQGFNTILTVVVPFNREDPGLDGTFPFADGDVTRPNEEWFARIDEVIAYAHSQDMAIGLGALWMKDNGGTIAGTAPPVEALEVYGTFLGERYGDDPNVFFFVGGDDDPDLHHDEVIAIGTHLDEAAPQALITFHTWHKAPIARDWEWIDFYSFTWNSKEAPFSYKLVRDTMDYEPIRPVIDLEPVYDPRAAFGDDLDVTELDVRSSGWWAVLAGAFGVAYGGPRETWFIGELTPGVPVEAVNRPAAFQTGHIGTILGARPWWTLEADWEEQTLTGDRGTYEAADYALAARARDGSLVVAYTPVARDLTVDLGRLSGPGVAQWYDPRSGEPTGDPVQVQNSGTRTFTNPLPEDAVLIVEVS